ncbi:unnamed protein product [Adineta steineri]|uniref:Uncharacterized protein n=1 Tax=Adineta steineri TaxID=433720 RepID=A0A816CN47_9BILA|nr:unnamed protein product [Adineta steineri]CAF1626595.1 unnamed protein product [Adineta steineri]
MDNSISVNQQQQQQATDNFDILTGTAITSDSTVSWRKKRQPSKKFLFICCDPDINRREELKKAVQSLKQSIPCALSTNDFDECEQWLISYHGPKRISLIISNKFGKQIMPKIHDLPWISAIYVYCTNRKIHTKWTNDYPKVHGVMSDVNELIKTLSMDLKISKCPKNLNTQDLLGKLSFSRGESSHKKYIKTTRKESQGDDLSEFQFAVINIRKRLDAPASAMLQSLKALTGNSILIIDDISTVDFDELDKKTTFLFVSSEFDVTMERALEHTKAIFVLEDDISKVDYQHRFGSGDDLIYQLADEIYRCYQQEAEQCSISGDVKAAEIKRNISNKMHEELDKAYNSVLKNNIIITTSIDA